MKQWRFIIYSFVLFSFSGLDMANQLAIDKNMFYTDGQRVAAIYFDHMDNQSQPLCFVYANR